MLKLGFLQLAVLFLCVLMQNVELFRIRRSQPAEIFATYFQDEDECMPHDYSRKTCKSAGCFYSCTDHLCSKTRDACTADIDKCYDHCFDPCDCKQQGCQFNTIDQSCTQKVPVCKHLDFNDPTCLKRNTYYIHKGVVCFNAEEIGSCGFKSILAVNFNGPTTTDSRGIKFISDKEVQPHSLAHTNVVNLRAKVVRGVAEEDVELYKNYITTSDESEEECIGIKVPMSELGHGNYEFLMKLHDPDFELPAERLLKIVVNEDEETPLVTALDMLSYVECDTGIDIGVKFTVYERSGHTNTHHSVYYEIPGYPPKRMPNHGMAFTVCRMTCEYTGQGNLPLASAMYVAKT